MRRGLVVGLCAVCVAGCGDDIVPAFRVVAISPGDGMPDVELLPEVVIALSEPVDPDTVDETTVALEGVETDLMVEGSAIRLVPTAPLRHDTEQRVTVMTGLVSLTGVPLDQPVTSTFTTRWRAWSEPAAIGPGSEQTGPSPFRPMVVGTPTGDAVAVWEDDATGAYRLSGARYAVESGTWLEDAEIASGGAEYTLDPQLAADAAGNILLVWRSANRIEHAWYHADNSAWYHRAPVHIGAAVLSAPLLAMSPGGKGAALWSEPGVGRLVARLDGDAWSPPESLGAGTVAGAALATDDDGAITIVWKNRSGLVAQRSDAGGWGERVRLWSDGPAGTADRVRVASMPGGAAIAVWGVVIPGGAEVHARFYDPGPGAWSIDEVIGTADGAGAAMPDLAVTAAGDVLVVWSDPAGGLAARWWRGAWEEVAAIADVLAPEHAVAVDAGGNAITAYGDIDGAFFRAERDAWTTAGLAASPATVPIAVTFAGADPVAVWEQYSVDGQQQGIRASFFR